MTLQEIYNKVRKHLLTQNKRASQNGACRYRTADGSMCAIGCLITDAEYKPEWEGTGVNSLARDPGTPAWLRVHENALCQLQDIHDGAPVEHWAHHLDKFASLYGLEIVE